MLKSPRRHGGPGYKLIDLSLFPPDVRIKEPPSHAERETKKQCELVCWPCIAFFQLFLSWASHGRINDLMLYVDLELKGRGPQRRAGAS
jgi:hypothetical protein